MKKFHDVDLLDIPIIPGTHHSSLCKPRSCVTYPAWPWVKCQELGLYAQLEAGVRFVDLRVCVGERIMISHTFLSNTCLQDSLQEIGQFLSNNPSEGIIMLVRADFHFGIDADGQIALSEALRNSGLEFISLASSSSLEDIPVRAIAGKVLLVSEENTLVTGSLPFGFKTSLFAYHDIWRSNTPEEARNTVDGYMRDKSDTNSHLLKGVALDGSFRFPSSRALNRWFLNSLRTNPDWRHKQVKLGLVMIDFADEPTLQELLSYNELAVTGGFENSI